MKYLNGYFKDIIFINELTEFLERIHSYLYIYSQHNAEAEGAGN